MSTDSSDIEFGADSPDLEEYQRMLTRFEPGISMVDCDVAFASIAISLKRIADILERDRVDAPVSPPGLPLLRNRTGEMR